MMTYGVGSTVLLPLHARIMSIVSNASVLYCGETDTGADNTQPGHLDISTAMRTIEAMRGWLMIYTKHSRY